MPRRATTFFLAGSVAGGCGLTELRTDEIGDAPQCQSAQRWPAEYAELEDALADAIAEIRDSGVECGDQAFQGVGDLSVNPQLRCAARLDATMRVETGELDQHSTEVVSAFARVNLAGYTGIVRHQLIAADFFDAGALLGAWLQSPEHCAAMLDKDLAHVGIGHSRTSDDAQSVFVVFTGEDRD